MGVSYGISWLLSGLQSASGALLSGILTVIPRLRSCGSVIIVNISTGINKMDNVTKDNAKEKDIAMEDEGADAVVVEDDLASFREQWKKELGGKSGKSSEKVSQEKELKLEEDDVHVKARQFFLQGVKYEESGKLYEAIRFYK